MEASVRAHSVTTTDALVSAPSYFGGSVRSGATIAVVNIRRGAVGGVIIDSFSPPINTTDAHALSAPVAAPEGVFIDVDTNTTNATVWVG